MSLEAVRQVLGRAILDPAFRQQLLGNADAAMQDFHLSGPEREALRQITPQQFDSLRESVRAAIDGMGDSLHKHKDLEGIKQLLHKEQALFKDEGLIKADWFLKSGYGKLTNGEGFIKLLDGALYKDEFLIKLLGGAGQVSEVRVRGYDDTMKKGIMGDGMPQSSRGGLQGILIGLSLAGILIGLLLFLPAEGLMPMMGLSNIQPTSGELPPCPEPEETGEPLPFNVQFMLFLNPFRDLVGDPLCGAGEEEAGQPGGGQTGGGGQPTGGQTTGGGQGDCACAGVDYICKNADGSIASASYNATQCGGSGQCECREPNKTLVCPDGTYADFNPQCGAGGTSGGGKCICVCDVPDPQQPGKCLQGHDTCTQQACLP